MNKKKSEAQQQYWYRFTHYECVMCGYCQTDKERVYDKPRPDRYEERHTYEQTTCSHHWLL
jgi:hypothetical protein